MSTQVRNLFSNNNAASKSNKKKVKNIFKKILNILTNKEATKYNELFIKSKNYNVDYQM